MRVIYLNTWQSIILDVLLWAVFHLSIGSTCAKIPLARLDPSRPIFRTCGWEQGGRIYQKLFRVRT